MKPVGELASACAWLKAIVDREEGVDMTVFLLTHPGRVPSPR
jgi:hypothetical protein